MELCLEQPVQIGRADTADLRNLGNCQVLFIIVLNILCSFVEGTLVLNGCRTKPLQKEDQLRTGTEPIQRICGIIQFRDLSKGFLGLAWVIHRIVTAAVVKYLTNIWFRHGKMDVATLERELTASEITRF